MDKSEIYTTWRASFNLKILIGFYNIKFFFCGIVIVYIIISD